MAKKKDDLRVVVEWKPIERALREALRHNERVAERSMGRAVQWWYSQSLPRVPVRAAKRSGEFRKGGRGMLKKSMQPFVRKTGAGVDGGLLFGVPYAKHLIWGTDRIAGGKVKEWQVGDDTITTWPAKEAGGNPRGEMPVALPWWQQARDRLIEYAEDGLGWE